MKKKSYIFQSFIVTVLLLQYLFVDAGNIVSLTEGSAPVCLPGLSISQESANTQAIDTTITVNNVNDIYTAISVNGFKGHVTVLLEDGIYQLPRTLYISSPFITIKGKSGVRENIILEGDTMSSTAEIKNLIHVNNSDFTLSDLTLRKCGWHLVQVAGEASADRPLFDNVVFQDAYEQMLKVTYMASKPEKRSDSGIVRNCLFEYTAGIGPQYYIGGIDAHYTKDWVVQGNILKDITSPDNSLPDPAIHFWSQSENTIVERNVIINCDRGIDLGLTYDKGHIGGIIRNNMVYHDDSYHDVGIFAEACPDVQIYNNTIYQEGSYPNSIEYRFDNSTNGKIYNNLCNKAIQLRESADAEVTNNITNATASMFVNPEAGDLHLLSTGTAAIDQGMTIDTVETDFDGSKRPWGSAYDIGADEYNGIIFYTSSDTVSPGNSVILNWNTSDLSNVTSYGGWSESIASSGSITITPDSTSVYGIYGVNGMDTARSEIQIRVIPELIISSIKNDIITNEALKVYPSPASDVVIIELTNIVDKSSSELKLFNSSGQNLKIPILYDNQKVTLNCEKLTSGSYFYSLYINKKYFSSGKFLINR